MGYTYGTCGTDVNRPDWSTAVDDPGIVAPEPRPETGRPIETAPFEAGVAPGWADGQGSRRAPARAGGARLVVVAAALSAVLASGMTYAVLQVDPGVASTVPAPRASAPATAAVQGPPAAAGSFADRETRGCADFTAAARLARSGCANCASSSRLGA